MPQQDDNLSPADRELEAALMSLVPAAALGIDAIAAAFAAGQRSTRRQVFAWRCATAATMFAAVALWATWSVQTFRDQFPEQSSRSSIAYHAAPTPAPAPTYTTAAQQSVLILNQAVRERGIDGLPAPQLPAARVDAPMDLF
jgi:hypothetical protein